jgi:hypothetical protein
LGGQLGLSLLALVAAGCATTEVSQGPGAIQQSFKVGYPGKDQSDKYYAVLESGEGNKWRVRSIGTKRPQRESDSQEILLISSGGDYVRPAYVNAMNGDRFACNTTASAPEKRGYDICRLVSRLHKVDWLGTALSARQGVTPHAWVVWDYEQIRSAVISSGVLPLVKQANGISEQLLKEQMEIVKWAGSEYESSLGGVKMTYSLSDWTGWFPQGKVHAGLVQVRGNDPRTALQAYVKTLDGTYADIQEMMVAKDHAVRSLKEKADSLVSSLEFATSCGAQRVGSFQVRTACQPTVTREFVQQGKQLPVKVTVESVGPVTARPGYESANDSVKLLFSNGGLFLDNLSGDYVSISGVSCYVNGSISTTTMGQDRPIVLPPYSSGKRLDGKELCHGSAGNGMQISASDKGDLVRIMKFGFAVKYRRTGDSTDKTLYLERKYSVGELLKGAI